MRRTGEAGFVLPFVAVCLTVLLGFAAMAIDVGYWEYQQREQQSATDAAALGGARQLLYDGCPDQSAATTAARTDASAAGYTNSSGVIASGGGGGNVTVTVVNPPSAGPYSGVNCAVDVTIKSSHVPSFLTRLFGFSNGTPETTHAVAALNANFNGCIYLLSATVSSIFNGDTVSSPGCGFYINDTATFNGDPTFDAPFIGYAGGAPTENGTTFTQASPQPMLAVSDPCPEIAGCSYLANNPPSTSNCSSATYNGGSSATIPAGCYSSLTINGVTNVTFATGQFVFNGSVTINGVQSVSSASGGVNFYVTANGTPPTFNGLSSVSLSPMTTGNYGGILYYQVPSNTQSPIFNGVSQSISGMIYAPGATAAVFNGTSGGYLVIVVGAATFNGSAAYDLASPPPNASIIQKAVLAQ